MVDVTGDLQGIHKCLWKDTHVAIVAIGLKKNKKIIIQ